MLSYVSFGFLSPVGQILLDSMDPFTLNAIRTLLALPLMALLFGLRATRAGLQMVRSDVQVWILGAFWLALTFVPYLWSLKYLPPTITTATVYATPLLVAAWQHFRYGERVSRLVGPTAVLTIAGAALAVGAPGGVQLDRAGITGLALALAGVVGWSGYTVHLGRLAPHREPNALTLAAFVTAGLAFLAGALVFALAARTFGFEPPGIVLGGTVGPYLALYVVFPGVLALWLYSLSLKHADPTTVAVLIGIELVATAFVSAALTDETFSATKVAGLAVVIGAVTAFLWSERRRLARERATAASNG